MPDSREHLKEEALNLYKDIVGDDSSETLNDRITEAYNQGDVERAEDVMRDAYENYIRFSDIVQRSIVVSDEKVDEDVNPSEFPIATAELAEFHQEFEYAFMRYLGILHEVDDGRFDTLEDMAEEVDLPEWADYEDLDGSEILD